MILGIYGAGGLGREVYELAKIINSCNNRWDQIFFIDKGQVVDVGKYDELIERNEHFKNMAKHS